MNKSFTVLPVPQKGNVVIIGNVNVILKIKLEKRNRLDFGFLRNSVAEVENFYTVAITPLSSANSFVTVVVHKCGVPLSAYFVHVSNRVLEFAVVVVAVKVKLAYS